MNLENAIEIYLEWKASHAEWAPSRYKPRLDQFARYIGLNTPLKKITGDDIVRYHRSMECQEFAKGSRRKNYSKGTVAFSCHILKNFFWFWHGRRECEVNHKEILPMRYVVPLKREITEEDFKKMDDTLNHKFFDGMRKKLVIRLLWDTGMRVSELCDMDLAHIQEKHPAYGIRSAVVRTRKTMRYNLVAWSRETDELLTAYLGLRLCIDTKSDALLLSSTTIRATRLTVRTIQRWIDEIAEEAGLGSGITPHSFRHGKGHAILNKPESNMRDVTALLRHAKPESSYRYVNLNRERYLEVAAKYL